MSRAPHATQVARWGSRMGDVTAYEMISGALTYPFGHGHLGETAERVAERYQIRREDQDALAAESHRRAVRAAAEGRFTGQIKGIEVQRGREEPVRFERDEHKRAEASAESLVGLRPLFKEDGSVTAGNASEINDGAAALLLASEDLVARENLSPLAQIIGYAHAGVDPSETGVGPVPAVRLLLERTGLKVADFAVVELNEAFAGQACAVAREIEFDPERTNPNGGAIALGHPIGATGAIILVKLIHELRRIGGALVWRPCASAAARDCVGSRGRDMSDLEAGTIRASANVALVTGARRGIGAAIAARLERDGWRVAGIDLTWESETSLRIAAYPADVTNHDSVHEIVERVERDVGPIGIVVNNAGITRDGMAHRMDATTQWEPVLAVNLSGAFHVCRAVLPGMRARAIGRVVNISSMNGLRGQVGQANYAAAKGGLIAFTKSLALENARHGITANCVAPGFIETDMTRAMPASVLEDELARIPVGRAGRPDDIAAAVSFLVSDEASFITAQTISVNGGQYC